MAIILPVLGAVVGPALGITASTGWAIGSFVGAIAFAPGAPDTASEGPRLGDLSVSSSTYGAPIPILHGTFRVSGNIFWSEGIRETKTVTQQETGGGKGGGGGGTHTSTTFSYSVTFALGLCQGEIEEVVRIWANGKVIYDATSTNGNPSITQGLSFRVYKGTEDQLPDSAIVAQEGVANTPAHRGLAYIVFDHMALADFGNIIPNISVEIAAAATEINAAFFGDRITEAEGGITDFGISIVSNGKYAWTDYTLGKMYYIRQEHANHPPQDIPVVAALVEADLYTGRELRQVQISIPTTYPAWMTANEISALAGGNVNFTFWTLVPGKYIYIAVEAVFGTSTMLCIDIHSLQPLAFAEFEIPYTQFSRTASVPSSVGGDALILSAEGYFAGTVADFRVYRTNASGVTTLAYDSSHPSVNLPKIGHMCSAAAIPAYGVIYSLAKEVHQGITSIAVYEIRVEPSVGIDGTSGDHHGVSVSLKARISGSGTYGNGSTFQDTWVKYRHVDNSIIVNLRDSNAFGTPTSFASRTVKIDALTGVSMWDTAHTNAGTLVADNGPIEGSDLFIKNFSGPIPAQILDLITGKLVKNLAVAPGTSGNTDGMWQQTTSTFIGKKIDPTNTGNRLSSYFEPLQRVSGDPQALRDVVANICKTAGLSPSEYDTSGLTGTVQGYVITRQSTVKAMLAPLMAAYFFDYVETDYQIRFLLRAAQTVTAQVTEGNMIVLEKNSGTTLTENRTQSVEIPTTFTALYRDRTANYEQQAHSASRVKYPLPSVPTNHTVVKAYPIALTPQEGKEIAEKSLYGLWLERDSYKLKLPAKYMTIDPSDVLRITMLDGTIHTIRVVEADIGADLTLEISGVAQEASQYSSTVVADGGSGVPIGIIVGIVKTTLSLMNAPLLSDAHEIGRATSTSYMFVQGQSGGWRGALLQKSLDAVAYLDNQFTTSETTMGSVSLAIPSRPYPFHTDEETTLQVFLHNPDSMLASVTQLQMLNGANLAALLGGDGSVEIINFRTVVMTGAQTYTLTGLLRGRRGTDHVAEKGHVSGTRFILLDVATGLVTGNTLGELNLLQYWKAVSVDEAPEAVAAVPHTPSGQDLKPYRPVHLVASGPLGADIALTWVRRTRVGGGMQNGIGIIPLSEDSEDYDIDIVDGGTVVRTINTASPSYTYTLADQTTDGVESTGFDVVVYQRSAQVGRGVASKTLTITT